MRKRKDVEGLINALTYKWKTTVRFHAARALGKLGDLRAVEPLIQALKTEGWVVRESAIWALGELGDLRAVEPLIEALNDENRGLRIDAARALGNLGDVRAIEPLRELLEDNYDVIVQEALWDLENIKRDKENLV